MTKRNLRYPKEAGAVWKISSAPWYKKRLFSFLRLYHGSGVSVGERYPYAVKVVLSKRVDPLNGVSLKKIREITGVGMMQRRGGLLEITKE